ncbi:NAD-dependent epimerase/dehydratase family protein [Falsiroseomonas sp.]|uniref:NAD-dependent epimerase/dehydratase family protein n=1 Tax=Falsiroseomonas sp. TaxID=2870721 RepID=UPI003561A70B
MTTSPSSLLVVGGGGFVGGACVRHLLAQGHAVHVIEPDRRDALPAGARWLPGSIEEIGSLRAAIAEARPAAILNFAAFSTGGVGLARSGEAEPERALAINLLGFRRLMQAATEAGVRRLLWSSSTVAIGPVDRVGARVTEEVACAPATTYGLTKHLAEQTALFVRRAHGLDVTGVRLPLIFGPGLWYAGAAAAVTRLVTAAAPGATPEEALPEAPFDAAHVQDVARLFAHLLRASAPAPIYHLAGFTTSWAEVAATLADLVPGYAPRVVAAPGLVWPLVSQLRLEQHTGFACAHDLRSTLRDLLEHRA